jgi:hypothetical protein
MRILVAVAVVVVFSALMIFDTAALLRLTAVCITGGCGVPVTWIAIGAAAIALAVFVSRRRQGGSVKKAKITKAGRSRPPARPKAAARKKPKPAK